MVTVEERAKIISIREAFDLNCLSHLVGDNHDFKFPKGWCAWTTFIVGVSMGYPSVDGHFVLDDEKHEHSWNVHPKTGEIIDITGDQFDPSIPPVYITHSDSHYVPLEKLD